MKPETGRFLEIASAHLMLKTGPALGPGYEQSSALMLTVMLGAVREEVDRAASRRVEENGALRALFRDAAPAVADAALRVRLEEAAAGVDESFVVSDLERANSSLRALLIELHAQVEESDGAEARRIEAAIWRELVASTDRRRLAMGAF